jgi:hypothetical protein
MTFNTKGNLIEVRQNRVTELGPRDRNGASSYVIETLRNVVYSGTSREDAVAALKGLPIGSSVEVRHPKGLRSCMNKPMLWADVLTY